MVVHQSLMTDTDTAVTDTAIPDTYTAIPMTVPPHIIHPPPRKLPSFMTSSVPSPPKTFIFDMFYTLQSDSAHYSKGTILKVVKRVPKVDPKHITVFDTINSKTRRICAKFFDASSGQPSLPIGYVHPPPPIKVRGKLTFSDEEIDLLRNYFPSFPVFTTKTNVVSTSDGYVVPIGKKFFNGAGDVCRVISALGDDFVYLRGTTPVLIQRPIASHCHIFKKGKTRKSKKRMGQSLTGQPTISQPLTNPPTISQPPLKKAKTRQKKAKGSRGIWGYPPPQYQSIIPPLTNSTINPIPPIKPIPPNTTITQITDSIGRLNFVPTSPILVTHHEWFYMDKGLWVPFETHFSNALEELFWKGTHCVRYVLAQTGYSYELDFHTFQQKNVEMGTVRQVTRKMRASTGSDDQPLVLKPQSLGLTTTKSMTDMLTEFKYYPSHWDPQEVRTLGESGNLSSIINLDPSGTEFKRMSEFVHNSSNAEIIRIAKIVNPMMFIRYYTWCDALAARTSVADINEMFLFHGTVEDNVSHIANTGFRYKFNSRANYGKGNYFSNRASYSLDPTYAPRNVDGERFMLIARACVGRTRVGDSSIVAPSTTFESTVNSKSNPQIFVTFDDNQTYPEFLVVVK